MPRRSPFTKVTPALAIANLVLMIVAAVKANQGEYYRYPLTFRLIT